MATTRFVTRLARIGQGRREQDHQHRDRSEARAPDREGLADVEGEDLALEDVLDGARLVEAEDVDVDVENMKLVQAAASFTWTGTCWSVRVVGAAAVCVVIRMSPSWWSSG
jgi:hypothetical protein